MQIIRNLNSLLTATDFYDSYTTELSYGLLLIFVLKAFKCMSLKNVTLQLKAKKKHFFLALKENSLRGTFVSRVCSL